MKDSPIPSIWNHMWYWLARAVLRLWGWRVPGKLPDSPKYLIIATHTSNWDLPVALFAMASLSHGFTGFHFCWMGKKELFWGPQGWLLRKTGGFPIDRSGAHDVVQQSIDRFARHERMVMIVTPEGTRKGGRRWKMGFYHIARGAGVPVLCGFLDYQRKMVGPGFVLVPGEDIVADLCRIRDFYHDMPARYPSQVSEPSIDGMERCPAQDGYSAWLAANAERLGLQKV